MSFCHITPISCLGLVTGRPAHLTLAHLVEESEEYAAFYRKEAENGATIIMDNSAFEMYKRNLPMYDSNKLIEMAKKSGADYIALSDYPDQPGEVTVNAAEELAYQVKDAGFGTFFIPQSKIGDIDDLTETFDWAFGSELVDYIGYSILAIPNAYGVEKGNKLQRFFARWKFIEHLKDETSLTTKGRLKKHHFLGMVDGPNEIELIKSAFPFALDTWDSSAAVWAGISGVSFDGSPTGLLNGKIETEVDFHIANLSREQVSRAMNNIAYIDNLWYSGSFKPETLWD